jgi:hypothetical protein
MIYDSDGESILHVELVPALPGEDVHEGIQFACQGLMRSIMTIRMDFDFFILCCSC